MTNTDVELLSFDEFDELENPGPEFTDFDHIADSVISRRGFLGNGIALGASAFVLGTSALRSKPAKAASRFGFAMVPANTLDTVTVPKGYSWYTVVKWGDPLWSNGPEFDEQTRGTGASQELAFGDNNDGMFMFSDGSRHVFAVNNEYTNRRIMYGNNESKMPETADDVRKGKAAHGVTMVQVRERAGRWSVVKDSPYNRKVMPDTPIQISGPARGHDWLKTEADPSGTNSLGTWNNCGAGRTPWGTYLACEENFNGYFSASEEGFKQTDAQKRYGIRSKDWGYGWAKEDERFDVSKHPNEPNRAGYVVEIDPMDPTSTPKKLTALGRFKHENAEVVVARDGHIVVYMGDDERGEFIYRFVSEGKYSVGGDNSALLESGKLYVAKFNDDQSGEWVELNPATTGMASQAEISIHTRQAASAVKATTMDRPEWVAANPRRNEVYCCLTNNKNRGIKPKPEPETADNAVTTGTVKSATAANDAEKKTPPKKKISKSFGQNAGGDLTPPNGPNPRAKNKFGQIVRWAPSYGDHTSNSFSWDLFVLAGNPEVHSGPDAGSRNINADNMFNSPDGLAFDSNGLLWIQTDGNYSNEKDFAGMGNNQMLVADPDTGEIKRFLVGPRGSEVTGICWSPDRRTLFVGIQHPGERGDSHFPGGGGSVPRSAIIAVTRNDGGLIG